MDYAAAKDVIQNGDEKDRRALAARTDTKPELLYFLAEDSSADVRKAIASNASTPPQADALLATDSDTGVRESLAEKLARVAPDLSDADKAKVRQKANETLEVLARDQAVRVREILADALKDVADAPPAIIRQLARDTELAVAAPVLEFSPALTDADLMEIIRATPGTERLGAISRRDGVSEDVSDAIIGTHDVDAVAQLLANPSAQIREETLDRVIDNAVDIDPWHGPLVARPQLSEKAVKRLALYVADNLVEALLARKDVDPATADAVREIVATRLAGDADADAPGAGPEPAGSAGSGGPDGTVVDPEGGTDEVPAVVEDEPERLTRDEAVKLAREMKKNGQLTEGVVADALGRDDRQMVIASISILGRTPINAVVQAFAANSAKSIVSVCWRAGLTPRMAVDLQQKMGGIRGGAIIRGSGGRAFGLDPNEMEFQLELLGVEL